MKPDLIRVHIEMTDEGLMCARGTDEQVLAHGRHIADLRDNVDAAVRRLYGDEVRITLLVGRPVP